VVELIALQDVQTKLRLLTMELKQKRLMELTPKIRERLSRRVNLQLRKLVNPDPPNKN